MNLPSEPRQVPLPAHLSCMLTVKVGAAQTGRTSAGTHEFEHTSIYVEGYDVFVHRVAKFVDKVAEAYAQAKTTANKVVHLVRPDNMAVYAKVGANDRQTAFMPMSTTNYDEIVRRMWRSLVHRANGNNNDPQTGTYYSQ